jgi:hypothetical protein
MGRATSLPVRRQPVAVYVFLQNVLGADQVGICISLSACLVQILSLLMATDAARNTTCYHGEWRQNECHINGNRFSDGKIRNHNISPNVFLL